MTGHAIPQAGDADFLLSTPTARRLYHERAEHLPIIDYHCHLDPEAVAGDRRFRSITELWLGGDHYKWRAMRANGVDERLITGEGSDWEKFEAWAATVPYCFGNPLYHWTHLELRTAFGIDLRLNPQTAREIYDRCNERLHDDPAMSARGLMRRYGVELVCTTDDPCSSLDAHRAIAASGFETRVLPTFRPDAALKVDQGETFRAYLLRLSEAAGTPIHDFASYLDALRRRHDAFHAMGCRLSDHGLAAFPRETDAPESELNAILLRALNLQHITPAETERFQGAVLLRLAEMDARKGWTQQFHYGTIRDANSRMLSAVGPDTGFDSIGETATADSLARFLDTLDSRGLLAQTILYNLNPAANEMLATMAGNFQDGSVAGKVQWGAAWWFNDQLEGMARHLRTLSVLGLLSRFVGMLTDSRSFLSYPRHDYFRRLLCDLLGRDVERGLIPGDGYEGQRLGDMVEDIAYRNAKRYFHF